MKRLSLLCLLPFLAFGCATVHQAPAPDREKMTVYSLAGSTSPVGDSSYPMETGLSLNEALRSVLSSCYALDIPVYAPLTSPDSAAVKVTSGVFIAKCSEDCKCGRQGAAGHGSKSASAILRINLRAKGTATAVMVESMFWRTQTSGGDFDATDNLYFDSLGRIEQRILNDLGAR